MAGLGQERRSTGLDLFAQPDHTALACEQILEQMAALAEVHARQIVAVEIEQIEGIEHGELRGALAAPAAQRLLQQAEISPAGVEDHSLAVEDEAACVELGGLGRD